MTMSATCSCYIKVNFKFGLPKSVQSIIDELLKLRFCFIHFAVTFSGPKNIVRCCEEFVK